MLVVVDAATGLNKTNVTGDVSDASWFSNSTVKFFAEELKSDNTTLSEALHRTTEKTRASLEQFGCASEENFPSASFIAARISEAEVEILSVGDCTAIIEFNNGRKCAILHDDSVTRLDNVVIQTLLSKRQESGENIKAILPRVSDLLIANRAKRNTDGGYWILDPTGKAIPHADEIKYKADEIQSITLMSDGFACITDIYNSLNTESLPDLLRSTDASELVDQVFAALECDNTFNKYPRFKLKDDASVVYAEIK